MVRQYQLAKYVKQGNLFQIILAYSQGEGFFHGDDDYLLSEAVVHGHMEIVKYLVSHRLYNQCGNVLSEAADNGHYDILVYLIEHGSPSNYDIISSAEDAAMKGRLNILQYLMSIPSILLWTILVIYWISL